ncbi:hypothetical protein [Gordonia iterans]
MGAHACGGIGDLLTIDDEFTRTQRIGNAINALAQAELAVAAVDELDPTVAARLEQIQREALG